MSPLTERLFFELTYATQSSSFMSPRAYALLHRMHHAYSDTPQDPHSPHNSTNVLTMMLKTHSIYQDCVKGTSVAVPRFAGNYPVWNSPEDFGNKCIPAWAGRRCTCCSISISLPRDGSICSCPSN